MKTRPTSESDFPAIQALHRHVGWPERSLAGWRWLHDNPARVATDSPAGWVVDGPDGQPAAHVGNLVQRFWLGDRALHGATGFSIIVTPAVRGASREIFQAFLRQPGMFAAYTLNANSTSQPLYARHRMKAWPEQTHALKLSWIINPVPLALSRLYRAAYRLAPDIVTRGGERLMNRRPSAAPRLTLPEGVSELGDLGDGSPYAAFWATLQAEGRLLADRSPETLRWRLADPDLTEPPVILAFHRGDAIAGYAMAMMAKANILEAPVMEILDLEALDGEDEAIPALMQGLIAAARRRGAAKLRLQAVSPRLLGRLGDLARNARREGGWGHCHAWFSPNGPGPALWSPTPYDGDYAFCLRPLPVRGSAPAR
ncbi:MAG: N-acetyltransferase [Brevundimonas sp.]